MRWLKQSRDFAGHLQDKPVERPFQEQYPFHELDIASPNVAVEASHVKWTRVSALFRPVLRPNGEWAVAQESPQTQNNITPLHQRRRQCHQGESTAFEQGCPVMKAGYNNSEPLQVLQIERKGPFTTPAERPRMQCAGMRLTVMLPGGQHDPLTSTS